MKFRKHSIYLTTEEVCMCMAVLTQASDDLKAATPKGMGNLTSKKLDELAMDIWGQLECIRDHQARESVSDRLQTIN
jgi:hypothetical protein